MGDACVGTVLGSGLDDHGTEYFRLGMVFVEPYGHAIAQLPYDDVRGVGVLSEDAETETKECSDKYGAYAAAV
jgi:hypothetical protein